MQNQKRNMKTYTRTFGALAISGALAFGVAACGDPDTTGSSGGGSTAAKTSDKELKGQIAGAGASSQSAAQEAWTAGFQSANPGVSVSYDPVGSGGGREQFNAGGTLYGGTDSAYKDEELTAAQKRCGGADNFIEAPVYISPIAVIYNLDGVDSLQLKPATIAAIFSGKITKWDDAKIKADNPDADLPSERITVVHRSDDSGTTNNFTQYLSKASDGGWTDEPDDAWPIKGQEAADGTSGVVEAVSGGKGTIGYADASQAKDLGVAKVGVGSEYVEPSAEGAAKIFDESKETSDPGKYVFTYDLNRTPSDSSVYPIVLTSYVMACTQYKNQGDADNVKAYLKYVASPEGQKTAAENAGSAPLPDKVEQQVEAAFDSISAGGSQ
jgi:phosphate transport system substrate-binding protein